MIHWIWQSIYTVIMRWDEAAIPAVKGNTDFVDSKIVLLQKTMSVITEEYPLAKEESSSKK